MDSRVSITHSIAAMFDDDWSFFRSSRPSDFSYKHDAKQSTAFMVARVWDDDVGDEVFLHELSEVLTKAKACRLETWDLMTCLFNICSCRICAFTSFAAFLIPST